MADVALWLGPYKFVTLKNLTNQGAWATCTGVSRGSPTFRDSRCRQALRRPWKLEQNTLGQVSRQVSRALRQSCDKEGAFLDLQTKEKGWDGVSSWDDKCSKTNNAVISVKVKVRKMQTLKEGVSNFSIYSCIHDSMYPMMFMPHTVARWARWKGASPTFDRFIIYFVWGFLRSFCLRCFCLVGFRILRRAAGCLFDEGFDVLGKETATQSADEIVFRAQ